MVKKERKSDPVHAMKLWRVEVQRHSFQIFRLVDPRNICRDWNDEVNITTLLLLLISALDLDELLDSRPGRFTSG